MATDGRRDQDPQTYAIIGAAIEAHRTLGPGFLEAVYQEALSLEFGSAGIPFKREVDLPIRYKGGTLGTTYRADFICYGEVIVELKSIQQLGAVESAQVLNYLRATGLRRALLFNFAGIRLETKRFVLDPIGGHLRPSVVSMEDI